MRASNWNVIHWQSNMVFRVYPAQLQGDFLKLFTSPPLSIIALQLPELATSNDMRQFFGISNPEVRYHSIF